IGTAETWPINIDRLAVKTSNQFDGYILHILSSEKATLMKDKVDIMRVFVGREQMVDYYNESKQRYLRVRSEDQLRDSSKEYYKIVLRLVEEIRSTKAKVIFNNSSVLRGAVAKLMENGDLR
ncbi:hypothetical protein PENTCL1PPCAC_28570, partial [Pristionchus entomophagus]